MTNRDKLAAYKLEIAPLSQDDGGGYQAFYPQLARTAVGYGETATEALADLQSSLELLLASLEEFGDVLPVPDARPDWAEFSGRVTLRLAKSLHFRLNQLADAEGVSLNSLLSDILQSGATALEAGLPFGAVTSHKAISNEIHSEMAAMRIALDQIAVQATRESPQLRPSELDDPVRFMNFPVLDFNKVVCP